MRRDYNARGLTRIRKKILVAIYRHVERQRDQGIATPIPPSLRTLLKLIGRTSTSVANYHVVSLHNQGFLVPPEYPNERATRMTDAGYAKAKELIADKK